MTRRQGRRLILVTLLLVLSSGLVYAEWREVGSSQAGGYTVYFDPDTIRRKGNVVKWWEMFDYKTVQTGAGISLSSTKKLSEYECVEESERTLALTHFAGNMGSGSVVYTKSGPARWSPVEPDSIGQALWKLACSKP